MDVQGQQLDGKFIKYMLEIEKRYLEEAKFQKFEKIRVEQWVRNKLSRGIDQKALPSHSECRLEEEPQPLRDAPTRLSPQLKAYESFHQDAT